MEGCISHWDDITNEDPKWFLLAVQYTEKANEDYNSCNYIAIDKTQEECAMSVPELTSADYLIPQDDDYNKQFASYDEEDENVSLIRYEQIWWE